MPDEESADVEIRDRLRRNVEANGDLTEAEAMELANAEDRAVRTERRTAKREQWCTNPKPCD